MTEEEIIKNLYAALTQFGKAIQDYQELLTTKIKEQETVSDAWFKHK